MALLKLDKFDDTFVKELFNKTTDQGLSYFN
jgi:hypothetical protein